MRDEFRTRLRASLDDENIEIGLTGFQRTWTESRNDSIARLESMRGRSFDELRTEFAYGKRSVRDDWEANLEAFQQRATALGATVLRARTALDAVTKVLEICQHEGVTLAVKTKSMATEEVGLNEALERAGVRAVESDLGEWLLQLSGDHPSHLVLPIIHRRREQVAALLTTALGRPFDPNDIEAMVRAARVELRPILTSAGAGITGANAAIVSNGALMLVTNEGNAGLTLSVPPVHIALVGIEKLVATTSDAIDQVRLLARSATGQSITTYTTFVAGPRFGQKQFIVLLDNGRTEMNADSAFESALSCIRCGACADVCAPYSVVGGHAFGYVYTGAIGLVTTPFHHGLDKIAEAQSLCVSCGACTAVCPANIPLAEQILRVRSRVLKGPQTTRTRVTRATLQLFRFGPVFRSSTRIARVVLSPLSKDGTLRVSRPTRHLGWRRAPAALGPAARKRIAALGPPTERGNADVMLFLQCVSDAVAPSIGLATYQVLSKLGARVYVPPSQHCCGLPALDAGDRDLARKMALQTIDALHGDVQVVTPAPSCAIAIKHDYRILFEGDEEQLARVTQLASRTTDLVSYLQSRVSVDEFAEPDESNDVVVHTFCQSTNVLGLGQAQDDLIKRINSKVCPLPDASTCCGFGGSTSLLEPELARRLLDRKLDAFQSSGAFSLVTDNPGCALHIRGGAAARELDARVLHIAEYLSERLP